MDALTRTALITVWLGWIGSTPFTGTAWTGARDGSAPVAAHAIPSPPAASAPPPQAPVAAPTPPSAPPPPASVSAPAPAPVPAPEPFPTDALLAAIRSQSAFRGTIAWAEIEPEARASIARATTDQERARAIVKIFATMEDVHSVLTYRGSPYSHYEGLDPAAYAKIRPLLERQQAQTGKVESRLLDGGIGYVLVPAMPATTAAEVDRFARELQSKVAAIAAQKPSGWIVDLRLNGGGNLYPMLLGLGALLGEGVAGGTADANGVIVQQWVLKPDGLYWRDGTGDRRFVELAIETKSPAAVAPVAVLLGPMTRSSGQATALAFQGRPRCILMGEATARGYTTVTDQIPVDAQTHLQLAVGFMTDRIGKPCKSVVLPEQPVAGQDAFDALPTDPKVVAATAWLKRAAQGPH